MKLYLEYQVSSQRLKSIRQLPIPLPIPPPPPYPASPTVIPVSIGLTWTLSDQFSDKAIYNKKKKTQNNRASYSKTQTSSSFMSETMASEFASLLECMRLDLACVTFPVFPQLTINNTEGIGLKTKQQLVFSRWRVG